MFVLWVPLLVWVVLHAREQEEFQSCESEELDCQELQVQ